MAGSRGSGGGRGRRGRAMAKCAMHLSMAWGPMETQGALVDGTVHVEVSQAMTLKACVRVFRVRGHQGKDSLQSVVFSFSLSEEHGFAGGDRAGRGRWCKGGPKNWRGHSQGSVVFSDELIKIDQELLHSQLVECDTNVA